MAILQILSIQIVESTNSLKKLTAWIVGCSFLLFLISLTQDAFSFKDQAEFGKQQSLFLLIIGGLSILGGGLLEWIVWLANPLYFLTVILFWKQKSTAVLTSFGSLILAASFAYWKHILISENGRQAAITRLESGYYLWLFSMLVLSIGTLLILAKKLRNTTANI